MIIKLIKNDKAHNKMTRIQGYLNKNKIKIKASSEIINTIHLIQITTAHNVTKTKLKI